VRKSSGFEILDDSAVATVRDRWKFIPAKRNGEPIEATVTFPIRFQLDQG
jgi:protein TonB